MIMQSRLAFLMVGLVCSALIAGCAREEPQASSTVTPAATQVSNVPGPYDGTWQFDAPDAGTGSSSISDVSACEAVRLQFQVINNQIQGSLGRSPYGGRRVTQSGPGTTPVSGTVQPDGTINAQWQDYRATGTLTGDKPELRWRGPCGPRVATGSRIASTQGAGSTGGAR